MKRRYFEITFTSPLHRGGVISFNAREVKVTRGNLTITDRDSDARITLQWEDVISITKKED